MRRIAGWAVAAAITLVGLVALPAGSNAASFFLSVVLPTLAPWLAAAALGIAGLALWRNKKALALLAAAGAVLPVWAIAGQYVGASRAGVSLNLARAMAPGSMEASTPPQTVHGMQVYGAEAGKAKPIIFNVHGGGWKDDAEMPATLEELARAGFVVVRPTYPLADAEHPTFDAAPAALADAYRWVSEHPHEVGGDAGQIYVFGDSAGGGLGLNLAYRVAQGLDAGSTPRAVVALYPTVDLEAVEGVKSLGAFQAVRDYLGGSSAEHPERYREQDTATWLSPEAPPTLIIQGGRDTFVPPDSVRSFVDQARETGVDIDYVSVPAANHAFDVAARGSLGQQLVEKATARFFAGHEAAD